MAVCVRTLLPAALAVSAPQRPSVGPKSHGSFFRGECALRVRSTCEKAQRRCQSLQISAKAQAAEVVLDESEESEPRFRLNNIAPQPGSRRKNKRKGRGIAAGQGASCGFGMRGQKSRSGPGVRAGFEGGQMPLYRRLPKLRGIAGGMGAGLPKHVAINLDDISESFSDGEEVSLESLKEKRIINPSGRDRRLPLKVLGVGSIEVKLVVKAAAFSASARTKLEAAGCTLEVLPGRKKFIGGTAKKAADRAAEYFAKKAAAAEPAP
eukprot:TRINITY_DN24490_c0_g1_i1.p1 TRINITY_DN24490_c0_g1~~TRINITY_DN24490_c0_g1_i1.p1  ORF type:complete len:265 (-),score=39.34 TRINITY_DN24490_c0_g1_i1:272-1066(-)